jgi:AcrR family transcriptional regulator
VARPRLHPLDDLLDIAERLVTSGDPAGLTLRGLAASAGASNGTIYHAFRSKEELLARLWLRATARLGAVMEEAVRSAGDGRVGGEAGREAVVAVAASPVVLARTHPASAQLFFAQRSDQLFSSDLAPAILAELETVQKRFIGLLTFLAEAVWQRSDHIAVEAIAACVVDVPGGLLRRRLLEGRTVDSATERRIEKAVRAILSEPLDPAPRPRRDRHLRRELTP